MKTTKTNLKTALEIVRPGLATKELIEQSTSFAFLSGHVATYNDEISIMHPLDKTLKGLSGAVKAEEFYNLLNKLKQEEIEITLTEAEIQITAGKSRAGLTLQQEVKLPLSEVGDIGEFTPLTDDFCKALQFTSNAAGTDMSRPILTCVNVTPKGFMEASDGYRICRTGFKKLPFKTPFLIPSAAVKHITGMKPTGISLGSGWLHFQNEQGTILSCRTFNEEFPDVAPHMVVSDGVELMLPKTITEMLERAQVFSKKDHSADEAIDCEVKDKQFTITGQNEYGWYEESTPVRYTGDEFSFTVTPYLLKDILGKTGQAVIGQNKIRFEGEGWEFIAMLREASPKKGK